MSVSHLGPQHSHVFSQYLFSALLQYAANRIFDLGSGDAARLEGLRCAEQWVSKQVSLHKATSVGIAWP